MPLKTYFVLFWAREYYLSFTKASEKWKPKAPLKHGTRPILTNGVLDLGYQLIVLLADIIPIFGAAEILKNKN